MFGASDAGGLAIADKDLAGFEFCGEVSGFRVCVMGTEPGLGGCWEYQGSFAIFFASTCVFGV